MSPRVSAPGGGGGDPIRSSALGHQPELAEAFVKLYGILWGHGIVDAPTKELARLRNARLTGCGYCRNIRFDRARAEGLSEAMVDEIRDGYEASSLSERQKRVLRFTDVFLRDPGGASDALRADLLAEFTPEEIVELAAGVALFMGFSKIAVALGQAPESMPTLVVPTPDWKEPETRA
jgi:AhpD family alkylhydroperoxidase